MVLLDERYEEVWDKVYDTLHFFPTTGNTVLPFKISAPHTVFGISCSKECELREFHRLITEAFINCTAPGELLYALDWQHSAFLFDPRKPEQMESIYVEDSKYSDGGYWACFPDYYPDGDYYFFIDEQFRFGYLSHPWREEVWVFGDCLISEFESIYKQLGWVKKEGI